MSNTGDNGPLVPRRSLGKSSPVSDTATQPITPRYADQPDRRLQQGQPGVTDAPGHAASPFGGGAPTTATVPPPQAAPPQQPQADGPAHAAPPQKPPKRPGGRGPRTIRRAKLRLVRIDPWSVTKVSFLLSIAFGIMCVVAVFLIFSIMNAAGLWDHVNETVQGVLREQEGEQFDITEYVGMSRVMGITMLIAAVDVVLITALATLGAFIYNMGASLLGGVEVTLAEDIK